MIVALLKDGFDDNRVLSLNILTDNVLKVHVRQSVSVNYWRFFELKKIKSSLYSTCGIIPKRAASG